MSYLDKAALKVVGTRPIRPDGVDKVIGRASFGADHTMPGMLWGKVKRSPHAHARIKKINIDKALKVPGVHAIVTSAEWDHPDVFADRAAVVAAFDGWVRRSRGSRSASSASPRSSSFSSP